MTKHCLIKIIKNNLNLCNSTDHEKRVYGKLYHYCKDNLDLSETAFYNKLKITTLNPYKKDRVHPTNPELTRKGKNLYSILNDGLMDTFSLNLSYNINNEKLAEIRNREFNLIKDFYSKNG